MSTENPKPNKGGLFASFPEDLMEAFMGMTVCEWRSTEDFLCYKAHETRRCEGRWSTDSSPIPHPTLVHRGDPSPTHAKIVLFQERHDNGAAQFRLVLAHNVMTVPEDGTGVYGVKYEAQLPPPLHVALEEAFLVREIDSHFKEARWRQQRLRILGKADDQYAPPSEALAEDVQDNPFSDDAASVTCVDPAALFPTG